MRAGLCSDLFLRSYLEVWFWSMINHTSNTCEVWLIVLQIILQIYSNTWPALYFFEFERITFCIIILPQLHCLQSIIPSTSAIGAYFHTGGSYFAKSEVWKIILQVEKIILQIILRSVIWSMIFKYEIILPKYDRKRSAVLSPF